MTIFGDRWDTGNNQSPSTRTMQYDQIDINNKEVVLHVCNEETWRFADIRLDIDSGRYDNLPPVDLAAFKRHKKRFIKRKKTT